MKAKLFCLLSAVIVVWGAEAVSVPSAVRPVSMKAKERMVVSRSFFAGLGESKARMELGPLDMRAVAAQDAERAASGEKALRIGVVRELAERAVLAGSDGGAGEWTTLDDGSRVWRLTLGVQGARGVRVHVSGVKLPEGCELLVFETGDPSTARGPYTAATLGGRPAFWTGAVFTDAVTVECHVPRGVAPDGVALTIDRVAHIYREPGMVPKEGSCHNDVSCFPAWASAADGVAGLGAFYDDDYIFCTGCLLNDLDDSTWIDFFLTANHCVANQSEADDTEFYWFFQTDTCGGGAPSIASSTITGGGADYLAGKTYKKGSDFALLRLRSPSPDGATFNGWSTNIPVPTETLTCIHHPDGAHKRISFADLIDNDSDFWYVDFYDGATEPGSSGSPLFNGSGQVIGQLYGGTSSCANGGGVDAFGRFDATFLSVSPWLAREPGTLLPAVDPPYGTYNGPLYRDREFGGESAYPDVRGTLTMTASKTGRVTAKAVLSQKTLNFRSAAWAGSDAEGWYVAVLRAPGGETLELYADWIYAYGTLSGGSLGDETLEAEITYDVFGDRNDSHAQSELAWFRGYYTMGLPAYDIYAGEGSAAVLEGSGYLTLTVGNGGSVKLAGKLADGTAVSQSAKLLLFGDYGTSVCVPLFRPLYTKKGAVGGLVWIDPDTRTVKTDWDNGWFVRWDRAGAAPTAFSALLVPYGGYYDKNAALAPHYRLSAETNAVPYYQSGVLVALPQEAFPEWVGVTASGKRLIPVKGVKPALAGGVYDYSGENCALATLTFSASTGLYKGSFNLYYDYVANGRLVHRIVKASYAGVLTQGHDDWFLDGWPEGLGYYLVPDNDPALKTYRLKRSYWMDLYVAP
jgi:hypothetical protein